MIETIGRQSQHDLASRPNYIYGLEGLAKLIGCSKQTAHRIKNSGKIPFAKVGKKFIFNEEKVIEALTITVKEVQNG